MKNVRSYRGAIVVVPALLLGAVLGISAFTFAYADGAAYLSSDPAVCANCHVMNEQFDAWSKSSHKAVAGCNDCHAPHSSLAAKLFVKGINGFNHSLAFTTGRFPEPIRITEFNRRVTEAACRSCHEGMVHQLEAVVPETDPIACIRCHRNVGHLH